MKAPKKEKKELDDDELAFREKQKAGMLLPPSCHTRRRMILEIIGEVLRACVQTQKPTRRWQRRLRGRDP